MTQSELTKQPFFARFMETQNKQASNEEKLSASSTSEEWSDAVTLKFPSDWDDDDRRPF